jgi:hypothetical protein
MSSSSFTSNSENDFLFFLARRTDFENRIFLRFWLTNPESSKFLFKTIERLVKKSGLRQVVMFGLQFPFYCMNRADT